MQVLAGDIGGTKTLLQIADIGPSVYKVVFEKTYNSSAYSNFLPLLREFIGNAESHEELRLNSACFGIAGPVNKNIAKTTNLPWVIDAGDLSKEFGVPQVRLINDFQAIGYGLEYLQDRDIEVLQLGKEELHGTKIIIGAGTGLGVAIMVWQQDHYEILPSEGGHCDFASGDIQQMNLHRYLMNKLGRVDYDDILSGSGIANIFSYVCSFEDDRISEEFEMALNNGDKASVISRFALENNEPLAQQALNIFCRIYGAQAGNLALTCLATGGVYVAGGIAVKIIAKIQEGDFIQAFRNKGKMSAILEKMPVKVVMNPKVGLIGSAHTATRLTG